MGIDGGDSLVQLGRDVKQIAVWIVDYAMRPHTVTKVDVADDLARSDVDHNHIAAIAARLAHTRIAIDRYVSGATVGRRSHLMAGDAAFRNDGDLPGGDKIDDAEVPIALVRNQQDGFGLSVGSDLGLTGESKAPHASEKYQGPQRQ